GHDLPQDPRVRDQDAAHAAAPAAADLTALSVLALPWTTSRTRQPRGAARDVLGRARGTVQR
ncbi:MAG: hypothetical protein M3319_07600, partial [Actinomycetota bacterium]|nr:hypothetical protein [Actinomycetota bacterium]